MLPFSLKLSLMKRVCDWHWGIDETTRDFMRLENLMWHDVLIFSLWHLREVIRSFNNQDSNWFCSWDARLDMLHVRLYMLHVRWYMLYVLLLTAEISIVLISFLNLNQTFEPVKLVNDSPGQMCDLFCLFNMMITINQQQRTWLTCICF